MKKSKSILLVFLTLLIGISLVIGGCSSAAKKPAVPNTPITPNKTSTTKTYPTIAAKQAATEANKIMGVNKSTAIVSGKVIYIGLDLKANLSKEKSAEIERNVAARVKTKEPGYTVMVTSDIDTVTRIKNVAQGISQGKPLSSFKTEVENINTRLKPKTK